GTLEPMDSDIHRTPVGGKRPKTSHKEELDDSEVLLESDEKVTISKEQLKRILEKLDRTQESEESPRKGKMASTKAPEKNLLFVISTDGTIENTQISLNGSDVTGKIVNLTVTVDYTKDKVEIKGTQEFKI